MTDNVVDERTPLLAEGRDSADATVTASVSRESTLVDPDVSHGDAQNSEGDDGPVKPHVSLVAVVSSRS